METPEPTSFHFGLRWAEANDLKLADKISNLRNILTDPPAHWDYERKRNYIDWGKAVVDALSQPNPILKTEFERIHRLFEEVRV